MNAGNGGLEENLISCFGPERADIILECVGTNKTIEQAIDVARKGTDIIVVGVFGAKVAVDMGLVQDRELRLIGTLMYQRPDFIEAIELAMHGKINLEALITNRYDFRKYSDAYLDIDKMRDKVMKVMIHVNE